MVEKNFIEFIWETTQISRCQVINPEDDELRFDKNACTLWPGYFGKDYIRKRILLVGHFPAGGTEAYSKSKYHLEDKDLYDSLIEFKLSSVEERETKYNKMNGITKQYMKTWDIYRLFEVIFNAILICPDDISYINAVPFRIHKNRKPNTKETFRAWNLYTKTMIEYMKPNIIICLGIATGDIIMRHREKHDDVVVLRRRIGDKSIDPSVYNECEKINKMI
jgi:hypothetical protein